MTAPLDSVILPEEIEGEDEEETRQLQALVKAAQSYVKAWKWCGEIKQAYFGVGMGDKLAVSLIHLVPRGDADEWVWVVTGDLPTAYLVTDDAPDPLAALE